MWKIIVNAILITFSLLVFSGCSGGNPSCVSFKNGTLYGSDNYTVTVVYLEDKRVRENLTDIMLKSSEDNTEISIKKEYEDKAFNINLQNKQNWYSLTELLNITQEKIYTTFAKAETTTYIINSLKPATITFKAIGGDYCYHLETGKVSLVNSFDVTPEFEIKIEKSVKTLEK